MFTFYEVRRIRASQLGAYGAAHAKAGHFFTVARIEGKWREVFDVWTSPDDAEGMFGADEPFTREIEKWTDWAAECWVIVRYFVEERSDPANLEDALARFRSCELVEVQVPVLGEIPDVREEPPPSERTASVRWWQRLVGLVRPAAGAEGIE